MARNPGSAPLATAHGQKKDPKRPFCRCIASTDHQHTVSCGLMWLHVVSSGLIDDTSITIMYIQFVSCGLMSSQLVSATRRPYTRPGGTTTARQRHELNQLASWVRSKVPRLASIMSAAISLVFEARRRRHNGRTSHASARQRHGRTSIASHVRALDAFAYKAAPIRTHV